MSVASRDDNFVTTLLAVSSVDGVTPVTLYANPITHRLLVDLAGGGSGTVQTVAVATANGFAGTSDGNASAPTLTLTTSITGILKGNGTAMSAVTIGSGLSFDGTTLSATGGGSGTVTDVSVVTANGVSGSVATSTTTPAITLTLGAITPTSVSATSFVAATPATDTIAGVFRRNNGAQAANILEIQSEVNATLASFNKDGDLSVPDEAYGAGWNGSLEVPTKNAIYDKIETVGNVTKVGTPANNQVGVWTGDGTIEGTNNLAFDGDILTVKNDTDAASNQVLILEGDRATPANGDAVYASFKLSDSAGNQDEFARMSTIISDVTSTSEDGYLEFGVMKAGTLTGVLNISGTAIYSKDNNVLTLGTTSNQWADLFLAEGGVINWDNGDVTMTQTGNVLAVSGGDLQVATAGVGTNADSVPTISSTNTLTNKRITKRVLALSANSATPAIDTDSYDVVNITGQSAAITSFTTNLTGTPTVGQQLLVTVTGTGAVAITWGASFSNGPVALPTTTTTTTKLSTLFIYGGSTWEAYATGSTV